MDKIVIQKQPVTGRKNRRACVAIKPHTYTRIFELAHEAGLPIETITEMLLAAALDAVEIVDPEDEGGL